MKDLLQMEQWSALISSLCSDFSFGEQSRNTGSIHRFHHSCILSLTGAASGMLGSIANLMKGEMVTISISFSQEDGRSTTALHLHIRWVNKNGNSKVKAARLTIEYKIGWWLWYISWMYQDRQEPNYVTFEWTEAWHSQISKLYYSQLLDQNIQFKMSGLHSKWVLNWVNKSMNGFLWNIKTSLKISWWLHYHSHFPHGLGDGILITGSVD